LSLESESRPARGNPEIPFPTALAYWVRLGFVNFGGPAGQIALMHRELVVERRWISEERFLHALNFCMLLPGPEAQQLAIYVGWLLHRAAGGVVAGVFFVLPSAFVLLALSWLYAAHGNLPAVAGVLAGLKPVVVAIVVQAVWRIGARALKGWTHVFLAAAAFTAISLLHVPFPLIVLGAGLLGLAGVRFLAPPSRAPEPIPAAATGDHSPWRRNAAILGAGTLLWGAPLLLVTALRGWESLHAREYRFFTQTALVTFGGAYAALAYVTQAAVGSFGWMTPEQAVDGLALAETTPGPLIMVLQFVGFLAAWKHPEGMTPEASAALGAALTTWAVFLPSFVFIFLGAPYVEKLRGYRDLAGGLAAITAAVVGVILNLALVFGATVLFPQGATAGVDLFALAIGVASLVLLLLRAPFLWVIAAGALAGAARALLAGA
jgi:chromate transporter